MNGSKLLAKLVRDEGGQDLIEYALLTAIIGIAGLAGLPDIVSKMGSAFSSWGSAVYGLWVPPDPMP